MKTRILPPLAIALAVSGCSSPPPHGPTPDEVAKSNAMKKEMSAKLQSMTPDERVQYIKQHPDQMGTILKGSGPGLGGRMGGSK